MPIHTQVDLERQLTIHTVKGEVFFDETMSTFKTFYLGNPTLNVLWDFREGTLVQLSSIQIKTLADFVAKSSKTRIGGKTAGVTPNDIDFGLGRLFSTLTEMSGYKPTIRIFRQFQDAVDWLLGNNR